jgi:hypothetical protein
MRSRSTETLTKHSKRKRVAIVGGGLAGASVAYQLYDEYRDVLPLEITIYEAASHVGGRLNSAHFAGPDIAYHGFVDTGASTFSADDWCVQDTIDGVGLRRRIWKRVPYHKPTAGLWDGHNFTLLGYQDFKPRTWLDHARAALKYGVPSQNWLEHVRGELKYGPAARKLQKLVKD